jgi:hypothetical protein
MKKQFSLSAQPSQSEREAARIKKQEAMAEAAKRRIKKMLGKE